MVLADQKACIASVTVEVLQTGLSPVRALSECFFVNFGSRDDPVPDRILLRAVVLVLMTPEESLLGR